jgi:hypothetical protein
MGGEWKPGGGSCPVIYEGDVGVKAWRHLCNERSAAFHQKWVVVTSHLFGVVPMVSCGQAAQSNGRPSVEAMTGHERADHDQDPHWATGNARQPRSSLRA